jgi:hypothetical protein
VPVLQFTVCRDEFPTDAGVRLGRELLAQHSLEDLEVDLTDCRPSSLVSSFFITLMQHIATTAPDRLDSVRKLVWKVGYEFQQRKISEYVVNWKP